MIAKRNFSDWKDEDKEKENVLLSGYFLLSVNPGCSLSPSPQITMALVMSVDEDSTISVL